MKNLVIYVHGKGGNAEEAEHFKHKRGETLSWKYLSYARNNPINWDVPTYILYGECDNLTPFETISAFSKKSGAKLSVMKGGEHWFHTEEQLKFMDEWLKNSILDAKKRAILN